MLDLDALRRWPDVESPDLQAHDSADALILAEATAVPEGVAGREVVVIGDRHGALTLGALDAGATHVRVHQDPITSERALDANADRVGLDGFAHHALDADLVADAHLVLLQLPRSLDALDEIAGLVARHASPDVRIVAGGRVKHMTRTQNDVLARHLGTVTATLAHRKARVLHASAPRPDLPPLDWPRSVRHDDVGLAAVAHGGVFAGSTVDRGTRLLLDRIRDLPRADGVLDLGCGSGLLATAVALAQPHATVTATDRSAAAVRSTAATAAANGATVLTLRDDAAASVPDASIDVVLLNPPFHAESAVHTGLAHRMFEAAGRVLRPGGELWCVWNGHLRYRQALERAVGATRQVHRDATFTVTASTRA
ncbi:class I SAM-dependent methyltransferase [Agrococcus jejuensis]|uniref:16S rRNA (Guanine1207-N2)-methyltransferase n=1 Tax=Agrococcus jejuensis TaxID=399736 RepID=A0A1G8GGT0_9MICO|nr:methyltransferase [Agrococcus jejuensis]SDH93574.1 16S rRNA (guanine1207-N2)-methyltransferase [Agrococcus jejuensis]